VIFGVKKKVSRAFSRWFSVLGYVHWSLTVVVVLLVLSGLSGCFPSGLQQFLIVCGNVFLYPVNFFFFFFL
jgi:cytochrome b subunit of formate dehydrogenase